MTSPAARGAGSTSTRRLALAGLFAALGVLLSLFAIPVGGARVLPFQHAINAVAGVVIGPWWAAGAALVAATLRFSLGTGSTWLLTVVAVVVLVVIVRFSRRLGSLGWAWAFGLLLGGALGNLTDRLVREPGFGRGHVVDFIDYHDLFIGNVADIAIVAAAVLIALLALRGIGVDGRREGDARGDREPEHG